jgi:DNA-directed DNA polymerase III subunit delta'
MKKIERIKEILLEEYDENHLKNSYIFESKDQNSALKLAREISEYILQTDSLENTPDFMSIKKEDMSIDTIRNIIKNCRVKPFKSKKIYVFEDSSKFNISMQNAFLKTLEEPPSDVIFILITYNASTFLDTIRSRCITYFFDEDVQDIYQNDDILLSVRKLLDILVSKDEVQMIEYIQDIKKLKDDVDDYLTFLLDSLRNMMIAKESVSLIQNEYKQNKYIHDIVSKFTYYELLAILDLVERSRIKLNNNCSFSMTMETMLLNIMEVRI